MNEFWRWLVGIKESPDWIEGGSWHIEFKSLPDGPWAVAGLALFVAAIAGIWFLYKKEGRNIRTPVRLCLAGLRLLVLTCVVFILLEMILVIVKKELIPSRLLVLLDLSESMELNDPYTDEEQARQVAERLSLKKSDQQPDLDSLRKQSRLNLAQGVLPPLIKKLGEGREVSVYGFANQTTPVPAETLGDLKTLGGDTAIGDALKSVLATHRGQPLAGVLLVTDGQSNAGNDPRKLAQQAGKDQIPITSLAVGTEQGPSNVRLVDVEANPVVFVRDPTEISVLVESRGLKGRNAVVTLEQRQDTADWTEVGQEEIVLGEDSAIQRLTFKITPEATGQYDYRARVADVGPELTETDNTAIKSMKVIRQRIRVLLIAGYPSPEVQFIRNALLRDPGLEFASWLQSAGEGYEHIGHRPIRRLPANRQELDHYDVIVLFDPDMRALGPAWPELLTKFVGDAGGGLIYVAGELNTQPLFAGGGVESSPIDNSWLRILPVASDPGLYLSSADVRLSSRETWNLELTTDGSNDPIFRFSPDPNRNREILASLPGMYWHFPVTRAKPGAAVLARHGDPRMQNSFGRHVLLAMQRYGPGRTVWIGFDSTYRWRYLHEEYFDGFWARVIDRIGRSKVLGGRYPFVLSTDKSIYRTGDTVKLRAEIVDSADDPTSISELRGEVELTGRPSMPIQLDPLGDDPSTLETSLTAEDAGTYMVRIVPAAGPEMDAALRPATMTFKVEPPRQELDNPTLNRALLEDIATASGGAVVPLADYEQIPDAFQVKQVARVLRYSDEIWDAPLLYGSILVLLSVEWLLRKRYRMA